MTNVKRFNTTANIPSNTAYTYTYDSEGFPLTAEVKNFTSGVLKNTFTATYEYEIKTSLLNAP